MVEPASQIRNNIAAWKVTLDGKDLTSTIQPRLLSISLTEKRSEKSDELTIVVHDADGKMELPRAGVFIHLSLGWKQGGDVTPGLVAKGKYKVDEVSMDGPPDKITIIARSADLTEKYRKRRDKSWIGKSIGAIIGEIAANHGLTAAVHPTLAGIIIPVQETAATSDMMFVRNLARRHDVVGTVKNGKLIFAPIGQGTTATGKAIPAITLTRRDNDTFSYRRADRNRNYDGVEANYRDQNKAKRTLVTVGGTKNPKRLKKIYGNEQDARRAVEAENKRIKRSAAQMDYGLALGMAEIYPDQKVTVLGMKAEISHQKWLVDEVQHTLDGSGGFKTRLILEAAG